MTDSSNDSRIILLMDSNFPLIRLIRERREGGGGSVEQKIKLFVFYIVLEENEQYSITVDKCFQICRNECSFQMNIPTDSG